MKSSEKKALHRPFEDLKMLLDSRSLPHKSATDNLTPDIPESEDDPDQEREIFEAAMADVKKMPQDTRADPELQPVMVSGPDKSDESEVLLHLSELIKNGKGFVVADTAEYIEGTGYNVNRAIARRLHSGEFAIQGHIDLHGQTVEGAQTLFDQFFKESIASGKRMVLIIHGRGLSSPADPVLKTKVIQWLTSGQWRKWVLAYASARLCDGGAGATYVLLRNRPATRRLKKKKRRKKNSLTKTQ
ncbi:MAG: Smr/MutS family protein [Deltaproteobacteria bacterium]|jgi:DNA-nicking Smr family endonuclease|nr:Smr/MutS family protein [Deltaproteobacteria bacterium]MBW2516709.1 Smr/MutS family protein [Deltaproteobacteria bacterium]